MRAKAHQDIGKVAREEGGQIDEKREVDEHGEH